ncbi:MAG: UDP-N-acetylmuramoyl-tripeptide--D-alanyl-D-alanine ligase [Anaerolineae bacterium]|nr:UDP-N-acetylmuramoyl-tripeptide--D-alanyl-D-alanine ligase [Anaerolineae bacterium]
MSLTLRFVIRTLLGGTAERYEDLAVSRCVVDSREARPGDLFFAFRGERADGQDYVEDAARRGAVAAVVRREGSFDGPGPLRLPGGALAIPVPDVLTALQELARAWRLLLPATVVGVTGSVGKTLTREVVATVLSQAYRVRRSERNYNNEIGLPLTVLAMTGDDDYGVLEMGMYALGEIATLVEVAKPSVGIVTNVGPTHLERLGSLEHIAQAKSELVAGLPRSGLAVLNGDDERVAAMASVARCPVVRYGLGAGCDVRGELVRTLGQDGIQFVVASEGIARSLRAPLLGRHSVYPCLAAVAVARHAGMDWSDIEAGLAASGDCSRMRVLHANGMTILDDTYNAAPISVLAALDVLRSMPGRRVAVLGDMLELGSYSEAGHREVGQAVPDAADLLVAIGPRARWIAEEAVTRLGAQAVVCLRTVEEGLTVVPGLVRAGDSVLVKGSRGLQLERLCWALTEDSEIN